MIQSVDRAVRILFALQGARRLTLSELAAELGLPPTTVHGIVRTLAVHGVVVQEHGGGRYQLGPAVLRLGNVYLDTLELRSRALTWAHELARRTGLAVRVGVLFGDDVVIIHHEPRPDGSRQMPEVGIEIPAHASALGKAMLAFVPGQKHAGNKGSSRAGNKRSSEAENKPSSEAENKPSSEAENKPSSEAENKPSSEAENKPSSEAENKPSSEAENKPSSEAENKWDSGAGNKGGSEAGNKGAGVCAA
ncbi:helix-turn-helix domain-containing protein [Nocardia terpenica]|uniref:helix-turn-helix domain-containing protein n=1 Tax=Nocardia terpenica TaxID=455432 RepID=UPI0019339B9B|nr:helix-turn-helix domain-containing protein [Nocardia terpenica]